MKRKRLLVAALALAAGFAALAVILESGRTGNAIVSALLSLVIGWSFTGAGIVAWSRPQSARFGVLMILTGFVWFLSTLAASDDATLFTIGLVVSGLALAMIAHLVLAFPTGVLSTVAERIVVASAYVTGGVLQIALLLALDPRTTPSPCADCPANELLVSANDTAAHTVTVVQNVAAIAITVAVVIMLVGRWRTATPPARRSLAPVLFTGTVTFALGAFLFTASIFSDRVEVVARYLTFISLATVPLAFLAGLVRLRLAHLNVVRMIAELGRNPAPGRLRDALARALGDPSLELAYWLPESKTYVDVRGRPLAELAERPEQVVRIVERDGHRVGALVLDESLREQPELVDAVTAAAGLALENERLQAELRARLEQLTASEERLRALIDASPLAIVEVDLTGHVTFWNRAAERLYGWTSDEVLGQEISFVPDPEERDEIRGRLLAGEAIADIETERLRKDGSVVLVELSAAPVYDRRGAVVRYMAVSADISQRQRAEDDLRHERDFISAVLDTAATLVIVTDREGRFVRFNQACERLTGYTFEEVAGRPYWDLFIAPEQAGGVRAAVQKVWAGDFPSENENDWVLRDGSRRLIAWSNTALLDAEGNVEYMVSSGLDITERKRAEAEVRASRARIVAAGDAERRRLERNLHDGAQQRLVALSLALRMAQTTLRTDPEGADRLLAASGEELGQALTELRELARGIHPAVLTDRGLPAALDALAGRATTPVVLDVDLADRLPPPIEAAAYYVVSEALANVAKYASASEVVVTVARANGVARIEVVDDGIGGADAVRGSGLRGLADRVEALDGTLVVLSPPGRGTSVRAEIPVEEPPR